MDERPTLLDIFAGIGGFSRCFEAAGFETIGFIEYEPIKRAVFEYWWPEGNFYGDIDTFDCGEFLKTHGRPDVIAGGPPCQAASLLGERLGTADHRWKWPQAIRLARELRPRYCVFENPPAVLTVESGRAFNGIVSAMAALGYDGWWDVIPAAAFGAGHWRERVCIVFADSNRKARLPFRGGISGEKKGAREKWALGNVKFEHSHEASVLSSPRRPDATQDLPDIRGRVTRPDWWFEVVSGVPCIPSKSQDDTRIPVLATGLPGKLVEAASLCIGDSIVPQAFYPIAQAVYQTLQAEKGQGS